MQTDALLAAEPPATATPWWVILLAPMLAAIVGGLLVSGYLWRRNVRWESNRNLDFRSEIASDMARVANALRFESIVFARRFKKVQVGDIEEQAKAKARTSLDKSYLKLRSEGAAIEARLSAHFTKDARACKDWHVVMDLGTILYFDAIRPEGQKPLPELLESNIGVDHTGLTKAQLEDDVTVKKTLPERLESAIKSALTAELVMPK